MPNIDVSTIEGFETMTPEQKVEALLKVEVPEKVDMSLYVPKERADKFSSEAAAYKKQLESKMSEEERVSAERDAKWAEMEAKIAQLEREKLESSFKASFLAMGYGEELAAAAAKAKVEGDTVKEFDIQKKALEEAMKNLKAELIKGTPKPDGAGGGDAKAKSKAVEIAERIGKSRADAAASANEILNKYRGGR